MLPLHCFESGMQVPVHLPSAQTLEHADPSFIQVALASQVCGMLSVHRREPGLHSPLQSPSLQRNGQAEPVIHCPTEHSRTLRPSQEVSPSWQSAGLEAPALPLAAELLLPPTPLLPAALAVWPEAPLWAALALRPSLPLCPPLGDIIDIPAELLPLVPELAPALSALMPAVPVGDPCPPATSSPATAAELPLVGGASAPAMRRPSCLQC
jgi:hypothetical protein